MTGSNAFVFVPKAVCDPKRAGDSREAELLCALAMALFRMLGIAISSLWVSAEDAQPCPKGYFCPAESRAWDSQAGLSGLLCPCSTDLTRIA